MKIRLANSSDTIFSKAGCVHVGGGKEWKDVPPNISRDPGTSRSVTQPARSRVVRV